MAASTTAEVSRTIPAPPADIWRALTTPELSSEFFMGATIETDWRQGSPITMTGEYQGAPYEDKGEVLEVRPEQLLKMSHWSATSGAPDRPENYHVLTFRFEPQDETMTKVTLTQANANGEVTDEDTKNKTHYEDNWASVLEGLERTATKPRPVSR